ncbi:hypothetical protein [Peptostreptococcus faecalis]|uniref:hypothetical protein n=1 Tax=Peptostreptococcus faecalis TaxID=2045015 RepID=UPI000C7DF65A|nr:hypothetical protein [Peptostreptococcus faecalis]
MNRNTVARRVSISGMLLALNTLVFILVNYIPTNTIAFLALASFFAAIVIIEFGLKYGCIYTIASVLMALLILSNKLHFLTYLLTFGTYGVVKAIIEMNFKNSLQLLVKFIYSSIAFFVLYYVAIMFIKIDFNILYILAFEVAFFVYDFVYTQFIYFYNDKLKKRFKL